MKFIISLFLVLCGSQLSLQDPNIKEKEVYLCFELDINNVTILDDTWFKGVGPNQHNWFDSIEFLKDISINSLQVDYDINNKVVNPISQEIQSRRHIAGSHDLCYMQSTSYIPTTIIRKLLGITEGCPIAAGEKKNTTDVRFSLANECWQPKLENPRHIGKINVRDYRTESLLLKAEFIAYGNFFALTAS